MEAFYYERLQNGVRCNLCPHRCLIHEGRKGICKVRRNASGVLQADSYGILSAIHLDPVEKKPLYHFYPGCSILSLGSLGCNMGCACCQNWEISQTSPADYPYGQLYDPKEILKMARGQRDNIGIAYTYNEPTVWFEFMIDTARLISGAGMKNVMVSNGYLSEEPLRELLPWMDAFNIDLKAFSAESYKKFTGAELQPVLDTLQRIRQAGKHLEITCLIVPGVNDREAMFCDMIRWIALELGTDTVLHLSRYHPMYKMKQESTSRQSLVALHKLASEVLHYVYVGNLATDDLQDTYCAHCHTRVIRRSGYLIEMPGLAKDGACKHCGAAIAITE